MGTDAGVAAELVTTACDLLDRHGHDTSAHLPLISEVALVRDELRACSATTPDDALADDLAAAAGELDGLLAHLERLPEPVPALTG